MRTPLVVSLLIASIASSGCATLAEQAQSLEYPLDTAILIGTVAYQINTVACAEIRSIEADGALNCYDASGKRTTPMTPVSDWRRKMAEEHLETTWASPKHQAWLFFMLHEGGLKKAVEGSVAGVMRARATIESAKATLKRAEQVGDLEQKIAQDRVNGAIAFATGGYPKWFAHQQAVSTWHIKNTIANVSSL